MILATNSHISYSTTEILEPFTYYRRSPNNAKIDIWAKKKDQTEQGIAELEKYANQYIPENSQALANQVEEYANSELPPTFDHAGLNFISPLSDNALDKIRSRVGNDSSDVTFIDLQQIVSNELTDLEDQQTHFTGEANKQCDKMINRLKFIEEAVLKIVNVWC